MPTLKHKEQMNCLLDNLTPEERLQLTSLIKKMTNSSIPEKIEERIEDHSPLPWKAIITNNCNPYIVSANHCTVCCLRHGSTNARDRDDALIIVASVNMREDGKQLVECSRKLQIDTISQSFTYRQWAAKLSKVEEALK